MKNILILFSSRETYFRAAPRTEWSYLPFTPTRRFVQIWHTEGDRGQYLCSVRSQHEVWPLTQLKYTPAG